MTHSCCHSRCKQDNFYKDNPDMAAILSRLQKFALVGSDADADKLWGKFDKAWLKIELPRTKNHLRVTDDQLKDDPDIHDILEHNTGQSAQCVRILNRLAFFGDEKISELFEPAPPSQAKAGKKPPNVPRGGKLCIPRIDHEVSHCDVTLRIHKVQGFGLVRPITLRATKGACAATDSIDRLYAPNARTQGVQMKLRSKLPAWTPLFKAAGVLHVPDDAPADPRSGGGGASADDATSHLKVRSGELNRRIERGDAVDIESAGHVPEDVTIVIDTTTVGGLNK